MNRAFCLAAAALFTLPVCAADEARDQGPFGGSVKFGFIGTSGSTQTSSLNTGFSVSYAKERWEHDASIAALFASKNDAATAEAYETAWRGRWEFSERDFVFGRLNWRKDRFAAFDTQFSQTLGYGRRMLAGPTHTLNVEAGAGARQSEDQLGASQKETILFGGLDYRWHFSETARFAQTIAIEAGGDNTFIESKSSVSASLIGALSLVASYTARNNRNVPAGTRKTDTQTAISLEYSF